MLNFQGSNPEIQELARNLPLTKSYEQPLVEVHEGEEPEEFWKGLGGQTDYSKRSKEKKPIIRPQLFHFSAEKLGDEISNYKKDNLASDNIFLLKSGNDMYVWIGKETSEESREAAKKFSQVRKKLWGSLNIDARSSV